MTGEVKDGGRKRRHQRSNSIIGVDTIDLETKGVLAKATSTKAGRGAGKGSWFKSKKAQSKESDSSEHLEAADLEGEGEVEVEEEKEEEKPVQRIVQGLYRDDDGGPSPKILDTSHSAARDAIKEFSKEFLALLKGNPDRCVAMESQMRQHLSLTESESPHADLKFLVQAYISRHLFSDFENASFGISNPGEQPWEVQQHMDSCFAQFQKCKTKTQTVSNLLENESNDTFLSRFCMKKFRTLIPLDSGADEHLGLDTGVHPDTPLYRSFLGAAVSIWLLQRLACSFEQKIVPIYPTRGDAFQRRFMKPVVPGIGDAEDGEGDGDLEIAFTVFPGFRVSESIVESLVCIVEKPKVEEPASSNVDPTGAAEVANKEFEDPASSSVDNGPAEAGQSASKAGVFHKTLSFPSSKSGKVSGSSPIKGRPQKAFSLKHISHSRDGEHGLFKKILSKFTRKKTPAKDDAGDNSSSTGAAEATSALPPLEEATPLEAPPTDATPATPVATPSVPGESSPLQPLNLEVPTSSFEPAPSNPAPSNPAPGGDNQRLYIPRAEKAMQSPLRSPLRSPRLSSVD